MSMIDGMMEDLKQREVLLGKIMDAIAGTDAGDMKVRVVECTVKALVEDIIVGKSSVEDMDAHYIQDVLQQFEREDNIEHGEKIAGIEHEHQVNSGMVLLNAHALAYHNVARYATEAIIDILYAATSHGADEEEILAEVKKRMEIV